MKCSAMVLLLCSLLRPSVAQTQSVGQASTDWQKAAGGAMTFEVASVREDQGPFRPPSFPLNAEDQPFQDPNGRFHANFSLPTYIEFAYKIWLTPTERNTLLQKFPEWAQKDKFAIEAVAPLHATKDQYRLMMQALLAERFGLKFHFEQRDQPVLAMVLAKPGKPGPRLVPHDKGPACNEPPKHETFPTWCDAFVGGPSKDGMLLLGARAVSMDLIVMHIGHSAAIWGETDRPVIDQTGLTGSWDLSLEVAPPPRTASPQATEPNGPTMLEAIRDQLGIKLKATHAIVPVPVIDHLATLSEN